MSLKKLFIFGATGDLVRKKVLPALDKLYSKNHDFKVIALGRKPFSGKEYIDSTYPASSKEFRDIVSYAMIDFNVENVCVDCDLLYSKTDINYFYFSLPPMLLDESFAYVAKLKKSGLKIKILSEKPFGANTEHARKLYSLVKELDLFSDILISDHYLVKESLIEFQKNVSVKNFSSFKIFSLENVGLEGRNYYDFVGAVNDMLQNHLLNMAFLFFDKSKLVNANIDEVVLGQYDGYTKEMGKESNTETFFYVKMSCENKIFEFASGKKIKEKQKFFQLDDTVINFGQDSGTYFTVFNNFFNGQINSFPTIDQSVIAWELVGRIKAKKGELVKYAPNSSLTQIIGE